MKRCALLSVLRRNLLILIWRIKFVPIQETMLSMSSCFPVFTLWRFSLKIDLPWSIFAENFLYNMFFPLVLSSHETYIDEKYTLNVWKYSKIFATKTEDFLSVLKGEVTFLLETFVRRIRFESKLRSFWDFKEKKERKNKNQTFSMMVLIVNSDIFFVICEWICFNVSKLIYV